MDEWTEFSDPSIWITPSIYIQVGIDYVMVFRDRLNDFVMYESSEDINDIISKLRQAIDEGKPS